jgi:hypothetical protein
MYKATNSTKVQTIMVIISLENSILTVQYFLIYRIIRLMWNPTSTLATAGGNTGVAIGYSALAIGATGPSNVAIGSSTFGVTPKTAVYIAVEQQDPNLADVIASNPDQVNVDWYNLSPLQLAVTLGWLFGVQVLLAAGAHPDRVHLQTAYRLDSPQYGNPPADLEACVFALIDAGYEPSYSSEKYLIRALQAERRLKDRESLMTALRGVNNRVPPELWTEIADRL